MAHSYCGRYLSIPSVSLAYLLLILHILCLLSCIALYFARIRSHTQLINTSVLIISSLYLIWGLAAEWHINDKIYQALNTQNITFIHFESTPTSFNTLLWRAVAVTEQGHHEVYTSVFDESKNVEIRFYPTENTLLTQHR